MDFFLNEILENERVRQALDFASPEAMEAKKMADEAVKTGERPRLSPGMTPIYVLAYLADHALQKNNARGISREITVATLKDINIWLDNYEKTFGKMGLKEFGWLFNHYTGRLFRLGRLQFEIVKQGEEFALGTHIPQGEALDTSACLDSFAMAKEFFAAHFPETPVNKCTCHSWLLCPRLADVLPEESNIVRFMRLWEQVPCASDHSAQAMERTFGFGFKADMLPNAPEKTGLQRRMKAYLLAGGDLSACAGERKL